MRGPTERRDQAILLSVVETYIQTGEPIGSRTLSKILDLGLSAATIRNVMADLTEQGYLEQPHTSAGRVPTDQAYRFYVNAHRNPAGPSDEIKQAIEESIADAPSGLESLLSSTTRLLAELTHFTGVVASPLMHTTRLKKVEFLRINPQQVFVVLITDSNMVHNKMIRVADTLTQEFLNTVSRFLNEQFSQKSLVEVRNQVLDSLMEEKQQYDQVLAQVVRLSKKAFDLSSARELYVEGQFNILKDFQDLDKIRGLLQALAEKFNIIELLDEAMAEGGVNISIGQENKKAFLEACSLVSAKYGHEEESLGAIGVIGPTRMDYMRVIPIIMYTAKVLSQAISAEQMTR